MPSHPTPQTPNLPPTFLYCAQPLLLSGTLLIQDRQPCPRLAAIADNGLRLQGLAIKGYDGSSAWVPRVLEQAAKIGGLVQLNFSWCRGLDAAKLENLWRLQHVRQLDLFCCLEVDALAVERISQLRHLTHLNLRKCPGVDTEALAHLTRLRRLSHLCLSGVPALMIWIES